MNDSQEHGIPADDRRLPRYEFDTALIVKATLRSDEAVHGRAIDLSLDGIAGVFSNGWDIGTPVSIQFSVPLTITSSPVSLTAVVRNRNGYRYGFEFIALGALDREVLGRTCRILDLLQASTAKDRHFPDSSGDP